MRSVALGCALCAGSALAELPLQSEDAHAAVFVEVEASRDRLFAGERVVLRLRFGVEESFLRTRTIQPFRQPLDLPLQVEAPWLRSLEGAHALDPSTVSGELLSCALGGKRARVPRIADRMRNGKRFRVAGIERSFLVERVGRLDVPAARLRLSFATRFRQDLLRGRVADDAREIELSSETHHLRVDALPASGRPPGFGGAVGRFTLQASAEPRQLRVGESMDLLVEIAGEGNFGFFDPPALDDLADFHLLGQLAEKSAGLLRIRYELVPTSEATRTLPAIPFGFFDPGPPAGYEILRSAPIALEIQPAKDGARLRRPPTKDEVPASTKRRELYGLKEIAAGTGERARIPPVLLYGLALAPWLFGLALWAGLRARRRELCAAEVERARAAAGAFRARAAEPDCDFAETFVTYLAARVGCARAAIIAPGLGERLVDAGLPTSLAGEAESLLDALVATRYGGEQDARRIAATPCLVDRLEAAFVAAETQA